MRQPEPSAEVAAAGAASAVRASPHPAASAQPPNPSLPNPSHKASTAASRPEHRHRLAQKPFRKASQRLCNHKHLRTQRLHHRRLHQLSRQAASPTMHHRAFQSHPLRPHRPRPIPSPCMRHRSLRHLPRPSHPSQRPHPLHPPAHCPPTVPTFAQPRLQHLPHPQQQRLCPLHRSTLPAVPQPVISPPSSVNSRARRRRPPPTPPASSKMPSRRQRPGLSPVRHPNSPSPRPGSTDSSRQSPNRNRS